jgi:hypothetical protein
LIHAVRDLSSQQKRGARTHKAEADAQDAKRALVRVEQAIRERLLK